MAYLAAVPEESTIRELELRTLQNEAEWFVGNELPAISQKMQKILQHCAALLSPKGTKEPIPSLPAEYDVHLPFENATKMISFETPEGSLKGYINVAGWSVHEAEINVKFPKWNKNIPYKAAVSATHPWRLVQLQNAYNSILTTIEELQMLIEECERFRSAKAALPSTTPTSLSASQSFVTPLNVSSSIQAPSNSSFFAINKTFDQVSRWMAQAKDALMIPSKHLFPSSLFASTGFQGFHPTLPQDLHVEFSVCNAEVIISVYALYVGNGPLPTLERGLTSTNLSSSSGGTGSGTNSPIRTSADGKQPNATSPTASLRHKTASVSNLLNMASLVNFEKTLKGEDGDANKKDGDKEVGDASRDINVQPDYRVSIGGVTYKTYPCTIRGSPSWVAVLDQAEVHCIVPRVNNTLALLTTTQQLLADIADKLVALSIL